MVSSSSLTQSGRVHKAFCCLYLPFHGLSIEFFFEHFGTFAYAEGLIYEADSTNEHRGAEEASAKILSELGNYLSKKGLLDSPCHQELNTAIEYFRLEQKLFKSIKCSLAETLSMASKRSFDFKLLHRILFQLNRWHYDEKICRRFAVFEELLEFDDDYLSRTQDNFAGTFNVINCLAGYSSEAIARYLENLVISVRMAEQQVGEAYTRLLEQYMSFVPTSVLAGDGEARAKRLIADCRSASHFAVRNYSEHGIGESKAVQSGLKEKAKELAEKGAEIYAKA